MLAHEAAGLAAIRAVYAEPIIYSGAGLTDAPIAAVPTNDAAESFQGPGSTTRQQSFEVDASLLPQRPAKGDTIVHAGTAWKVIDVTDRRGDVGAWLLMVKAA